MHIRVDSFTVHKRFALTISRGTTTETTNLWLRLTHDGIEGWGEASPFSVGGVQTADLLFESLHQLAPSLKDRSPFDRQPIEQILANQKIPSAARTALDIAIHDWIGKKLGVPLWQLWGGDRTSIVPTSVTIGISAPKAAQERLHHWMDVIDVRAVKVKLGSPEGISADKAMLTAVLTDTPKPAKVSIDANGGWPLEEAIAMSHWLAEQGITYIEQPLPHGHEAQLLELRKESPLPIYVDESCFTSTDIPALADRVDGINIKLMKSGGLSEALKMVHTAQACGLGIMFGCYSDSTLSNTAAAHLAPFATHLDLDSHLNLVDDPFVGATVEEGCLIPNDQPGLGVTRAGESKTLT